MTEKAFETKIKKYIESKGGWVVKFFANGFTKAGIPDLLANVGGNFVAIEVKAQEGKPSPLQKHHQELIRNSGGVCLIVYPNQWVELCNYLDELFYESIMVDDYLRGKQYDFDN